MGFLLKKYFIFCSKLPYMYAGEFKYGGNRYLLHVKGFLYRKQRNERKINCMYEEPKLDWNKRQNSAINLYFCFLQ